MAEWVLDTCLLYDAAACGAKSGSPVERAKASAALTALVMIADGGRHAIAEDSRDRIAAEYRRCWKKIEGERKAFPSKDAAHNFWRALWDRPHLHIERGVPARLKTLLLAHNMTEDGDIAFVEAAAATPSRLLTTEDGDYSDEVKNQLKVVLGIDVLTYAQSTERAQQA
jgi:hypothetical protein